jgi:Arc/MetJ family transcription regulator
MSLSLFSRRAAALAAGPKDGAAPEWRPRNRYRESDIDPTWNVSEEESATPGVERVREGATGIQWMPYVQGGIMIRMAIPIQRTGEHRPSREGKVRKEFWLDPETLQRAQEILGTATERETVEVALDMIAFRRELLDGLRALPGLPIDPIR